MYTGARLAERHWGAPSLERKAVIPFLYSVRCNLVE